MIERANAPSWVENAPILLWRSAKGGGCIWVGRQWTAYTGLSETESLGSGWLEALHPDDRAATLDAYASAPGDVVQCDHRIRAAAGEYRWHRTRATRDGGWAGASFDIDDFKRAGEACAAEVAEARRRLRNAFGVVRSVARRTAETSDSAESYAMHFEGRLDALSRVEGRIARGGGVTLEALAAEEMAVFLAREDGRLKISGPPLKLRPEAAETLALVFHELAANAVKFGALSPLGGRLELSWGEIKPGTLRLLWVESGVAMKGPARPDGFGADLIKRGLAYRLRARAGVEHKPDGVVCEIEAPLAAIAV